MTVKEDFEEYFEKYHRGFTDFHRIHMEAAYTLGDKNGRKRTLKEIWKILHRTGKMSKTVKYIDTELKKLK